jgi:hypothetical protein
MRKHWWWSVALFGCAIAMVACGSTATAGSGGGATPNTSPPTKSAGPIVIGTDHTRYAPTDLIQVTLTNGLATALYAYDHQASCSIFAIERQQASVWQPLDSSLAGCPLGRPTMMVKIAAGATYHATIRAGYLRQGDRSFPAGQYRLALSYSNTPPAVDPGAPPAGESTPARNVIYSATFTVDLNIQAEPIPTTTTGSGVGSGTAVAATVAP